MGRPHDVDGQVGRFRSMLKAATVKIGNSYFSLDVSGAAPRIRERVYCYELYHRLRGEAGGLSYSIMGEVDKRGHPYIPGGRTPDFLVHVPGTDQNLVTMEVKPVDAMRTATVVKDMETLALMRGERGRYRASFYLLFGDDEARARRFLYRAADKIRSLDLNKIEFYIHRRAGEAAERIQPEWPQRT